MCHLAKSLNDSAKLSSSFHQAGKFYYQKRNYSTALNYLFSALNYLQKTKTANNENESAICLLVGQVFYAKSALSNSSFENQKAEEFINRGFKALQKIDTIKKINLVISSLNSLGNIYRKKAFVTDSNASLNKALLYFTLALNKAKNNNALALIPGIEVNIGSVYVDFGDLDRAAQYYDRSLANWASVNDNAGAALVLLKNAELFFKKFEQSGSRLHFVQCETFAQRSLDTALKYKDAPCELLVYDYLSLIYEKANNPEKSLYYYKKFFFLNDSLFIERNVQDAAQLFNDFSLAENNKKINDLLVDQKLKTLQIDKEKNYRWFLFILVIVLIISISFILIAFSGRKKINDQLALKNKEILLRKQITPHFLFNMFNNLYVTTLKSPKLASEMVLGLADVMRYQLKEINSPKAALINEMDYVNNLLLLEKTLKPNLDIKIDFNESDAQGIFVEPLIYTTLVENAIKHGAHNSGSGYVYISVAVHSNIIFFHIRNAIPAEKINTLVSGTGLQNLKERLELNYKNTHSLNINQTESDYNVTLTLKIK